MHLFSVCTLTCAGVQVEVRGQPSRVDLFFHQVDPAAQTQLVSLGARHLYPLAIAPASGWCLKEFTLQLQVVQ